MPVPSRAGVLPLAGLFAALTSPAWGTFARVSTDAAQNARPATDVDRIAEDFLEAFVGLSPITATYLGIAGHDEDLDDFSPAGHEAACRAAPAHTGRARARDPGRRHRPRHHRRHAGAPRAGRGDPPGRPGRDVVERHRVPAPGGPRHLRPHAHCHQRGLGRHLTPPGQGAGRPRPVGREPALRGGQGQRRATAPGRGVHQAVLRPHGRRRLLRHPALRREGGRRRPDRFGAR